MIDDVRKLIFVHIARTGGTSIETALIGSDWWHIDPLSKHLSASQARQLYGEERWTDYRKFSVVRNPWDRVVSMWATGWWHAGSTQSSVCAPFCEFIRNLRPHPHERYGALSYDRILDQQVDFILRYENLAGEFARMLSGLGLAQVVLPRVECRDHLPYRQYYDEQSDRLIRDLFAADIAAYGYEF